MQSAIVIAAAGMSIVTINLGPHVVELLLAAAALLFFSVILLLRWLVMRRVEEPLAHEEERRKAREAHRRDEAFYENFGVFSTEDFVLNSRGAELFVKQWLPADGMYKAVVLYCHGYGDTCTHVFEDVAMTLAMAHFAVISFDYEGHGLSSGLHGFIPRFDNLVDDVMEVAGMIKERPEFRFLPTFLYGESMGGAVALKAHRRQPSAWDGAVLVAPMCKISEEMMPSPSVVFILKLLARFFPRWKLVPTRDIADIGFRDPLKRSRVKANPVAYHGKPRLGTALQLLLTTEEIGRNLHEVRLPLLVLHGGDDIVTDPKISHDLYCLSQSNDKTFKLYEGAWHGLTAGEPDEMMFRVLDDIINWLNQRSLNLGASLIHSSSPWVGLKKLHGDHELGSMEEDAVSTLTDQ